MFLQIITDEFEQLAIWIISNALVTAIFQVATPISKNISETGKIPCTMQKSPNPLQSIQYQTICRNLKNACTNGDNRCEYV